MEEQEIPDNIPCPYCGAANSPESEFCGACYKNLHIPSEVRAAAKVQRLIEKGLKPGADSAEEAAARPAGRAWTRLLIIAGLLLFYTQWLRNPVYFSPLDFVNLAFHEAGHIFLNFFGHFIMMSGGTLFQLLLPTVCLVHLLRRGANIGWQLCLFWIGENLLNISIYAGDAIRQDLPLVGSGGHDWTYLLTATGLIAHTDGVAKFIFLAGSAVILCSFYLIARDAWTREPLKFGDKTPVKQAAAL